MKKVNVKQECIYELNESTIKVCEEIQMMCVLPTPASEPELLDLDLERLFDFDLLRDLDLDWRDPDLKVHQKLMRLVSLNLQ